VWCLSERATKPTFRFSHFIFPNVERIVFVNNVVDWNHRVYSVIMCVRSAFKLKHRVNYPTNRAVHVERQVVTHTVYYIAVYALSILKRNIIVLICMFAVMHLCSVHLLCWTLIFDNTTLLKSLTTSEGIQYVRAVCIRFKFKTTRSSAVAMIVVGPFSNWIIVIGSIQTSDLLVRLKWRDVLWRGRNEV